MKYQVPNKYILFQLIICSALPFNLLWKSHASQFQHEVFPVWLRMDMSAWVTDETCLPESTRIRFVIFYGEDGLLENISEVNRGICFMIGSVDESVCEFFYSCTDEASESGIHIPTNSLISISVDIPHSVIVSEKWTSGDGPMNSQNKEAGKIAGHLSVSRRGKVYWRGSWQQNQLMRYKSETFATI